MNEPIRVLIVEDHELLRESLCFLINSERDLAVCGQAETAESAKRQWDDLRPDVVVLDLSLKHGSGFDFIASLRREVDDPPVLVFSMYSEEPTIRRALSSGARAYLVKNSHPDTVLEAIRKIHRGESAYGEGYWRKTSVPAHA